MLCAPPLKTGECSAASVSPYAVRVFGSEWIIKAMSIFFDGLKYAVRVAPDDPDSLFMDCALRGGNLRCLYHYCCKLTTFPGKEWALMEEYMANRGKRLTLWCGKQGK